MWQSWAICGIGTIFCLSGVYLFHKRIYEEGESLGKPIMLMIMGVILIGLGTAKYLHLINHVLLTHPGYLHS